MKTRTVVFGIGCFLTGFLTCFFLIRQQLTPTPAATPAPIAMLARPVIVSTQTLQIDDGVWYQHSDGTMQRTPQPEMQPRRYDLIDTRQSP